AGKGLYTQQGEQRLTVVQVTVHLWNQRGSHALVITACSHRKDIERIPNESAKLSAGRLNGRGGSNDACLNNAQGERYVRCRMPRGVANQGVKVQDTQRHA